MGMALSPVTDQRLGQAFFFQITIKPASATITQPSMIKGVLLAGASSTTATEAGAEGAAEGATEGAASGAAEEGTPAS
jgi:hypothetical protein